MIRSLSALIPRAFIFLTTLIILLGCSDDKEGMAKSSKSGSKDSNALNQTKVIEITIKDHKFFPDVINVSSGVKIKLIVNNLDSEPEEFEMHKPFREKIIPGNSKATITLGKLQAGEYEFFGEFHEDTAKGKIIVNE